MFTGIIEDVGKIVAINESGTNRTFLVSASLSDQLKVDQSVSHDGVCLTVESCAAHQYEVTMIQETLKRSNLDSKKKGDLLNLERCLKLSDRLDGHIVQGHVDTTITCLGIQDLDGSWTFEFELPETYKKLVVQKGSICINGVSLTISALDKNSFSVSIIPYTYAHTNFSKIDIGDKVNVEFDILGKYVLRNFDVR